LGRRKFKRNVLDSIFKKDGISSKSFPNKINKKKMKNQKIKSGLSKVQKVDLVYTFVKKI
jgi:uncharacterized membrane protein